ncbi:MAG: hypothetical protein AMXMBFR36_26750 [Acidobacteriota bacterium]
MARIEHFDRHAAARQGARGGEPHQAGAEHQDVGISSHRGDSTWRPARPGTGTPRGGKTAKVLAWPPGRGENDREGWLPRCGTRLDVFAALRYKCSASAALRRRGEAGIPGMRARAKESR